MTPEQLAKSNSENGHQCALFCWAQQNQKDYPEVQWLFHIANGGLRDKITAGRLKAAGVKPGVPDLFLPIRRLQYPGLWIELKRPGVKKASNEQQVWLEMLLMQGYAAQVCIGWEHARDTIIKYLNLREWSK